MDKDNVSFHYGIMQKNAVEEGEESSKQIHDASPLWVQKFDDIRKKLKGEYFSIYCSGANGGRNFNTVDNPVTGHKYMYLAHYTDDTGMKHFTVQVFDGKNITQGSVPMNGDTVEAGEKYLMVNKGDKEIFENYTKEPFNQEYQKEMIDFCKKMIENQEED